MGTVATPGTRRIRGLDAEQRRAQRREQILAAAFELFARDGYANTAIEVICQTAYVGNKAFYELFDSKEDCYLALTSQLAERIQRQMSELMAQAPDGENEEITVRRLVSGFAHALVDDPRVAAVTFGPAAGVSPRIETQRRRNRNWSATFLEAFWRRNQSAHDRAREDHIGYRALAIATIGGLFETIIDWLHHTETAQPRNVDDLIADLTTFAVTVEAGIAARERSG